MSLRRQFILYLAAVHTLFAALAVYLLLRRPFWLFAAEAVFVASLAVGLKLLNSLFGPLELIRAGAEFIKERDFTSRFREVSQPEMNQLITIYNRMIDHLREERTRTQEQHYFLSKILAASPLGILTLDFDHRIAMANPSAGRMLQTSPDQLTGRRLDELESAFARTLDTLGLGESRLVSLWGGRRVKCYRAEFMDRGFARHFFLLEELTEELRQSEKAAYEKLIRMMSHEVNNSVASAGSLLQSSLNYRDQLRGEDREDFETAISVVVARLAQLNFFMKSFADVVRLPPPRLGECDLTELLENVRLLMQAEGARRGIEWAWAEEGEPLGPVRLDRVQMEQALMNVVKNAMEAMGEGGGRITFRTGHRAGRKFLVVEDTGAGIDPAGRAHLFTPFYSTKENGQGIGLTLVREILTQHRFDFALESRPGGPTQFTIYFN